MQLHLEIERLALLGWRLYPCSQHSRAACFKEAHLHATADLDRLAQWASAYPGCNWRAVTAPSKIWCLDVDVPSEQHEADGKSVLERLVAENGALPRRPTTRSGGGGWCLVWSFQGERLRGQARPDMLGLDPLRGMLSVTVPPSVHLRTRRPYRWVISPWELTPPPAPSWLLRLMATPPPSPPPAWARLGVRPDADRGTAKLRASIGRVLVARKGQRNIVLNREAYGVARWIAAGLLGEEEALAELYHAGRHIGMEDKRVRDTLKYAFRSGYAKPIEVSGHRS